MTLQELLNIAMRYATAMSDAMILACYECAYEDGVTLSAPTRDDARLHVWPTRGKRPKAETDYELMVKGNTDTRLNHC